MKYFLLRLIALLPAMLIFNLLLFPAWLIFGNNPGPKWIRNFVRSMQEACESLG